MNILMIYWNNIFPLSKFQTTSVYYQRWHIFTRPESRRIPSLRASPKSMSLILEPILLTHMMFSGLRSRCTMPCLWMKWTPSIICSMYLMTSRSDSSKSSSTIRSNSSPPEILQPTRMRRTFTNQRIPMTGLKVEETVQDLISTMLFISTFH